MNDSFKKDYSELKVVMNLAISKHIDLLHENNPKDSFYAYSLYSCDGFPHFGLVANPVSNFELVADDEDKLYYKYSADEWSHWDDYSCFTKVNEIIEKLHNEFNTTYDKDGLDSEIEWAQNVEQIFNIALKSLLELQIEGKLSCFDNEPGPFIVIWSSDPDDWTFSLVCKSVKELNTDVTNSEFKQAFEL